MAARFDGHLIRKHLAAGHEALSRDSERLAVGQPHSRTVSSLTVSVPVLSVAISVQLPKPSTAVSLRTITPRRAMRVVAIARATVIATGRPSGIAETASAITNRNTSLTGITAQQDRHPTDHDRRHQRPMATTFVNRSIRSSSGGFLRPCC
jgi:hypothetical protein